MNSIRTIRLEREATDQPWGFRLQGGSDFPVPLSIQLVNPNTLAAIHGLHAGDEVLSINGRNVSDVTHQEAKMEITRSGNELDLTVIKRAINQQIIHALQPFLQTKTGQACQSPTQCFSDEYMQNTPEHLRPKITSFQSSTAYNRDPLQREVWKAQVIRHDPAVSPSEMGTAVYHAQYNSPIGLYSDDKVLETFKSQTAHLLCEVERDDNEHGRNPASSIYPANMPCSSEGRLSRSFRALEQDLYSIQGTSRAPKSIFNQRRS